MTPSFTVLAFLVLLALAAFGQCLALIIVP